MEGLSNPDRLKKTPIDDLTKTLKKESHSRIGHERAVQLKEVAEASFGVPSDSNGRSIALRFGAQLELIDHKITQPLMRETVAFGKHVDSLI